MGVEHKAVAQAVIDAVQGRLGVKVRNVVAFVSDSASVLRAAYEHELQKVFRESTWVRCLSHGLNNVAKVCMFLVPLFASLFPPSPSSMSWIQKSQRFLKWGHPYCMPKHSRPGGADGLRIAGTGI